nr:MAG TPA: hypothetical protein [Caudoviricetes sp.]
MTHNASPSFSPFLDERRLKSNDRAQCNTSKILQKSS